MRLAPGGSDDLVDNKDAGKITFTKNKGRISLKMKGKNIGGERLLSNRLSEMASEVKSAQAGSAVSTMKDDKFQRHGIKSTFPKWFGSAGFNSKKDFMKVINSKKGIRYDRLVNMAIDDLSKGYNTSHGRVPASEEFQVKTRQKFNNKGIVFRTIKGRVVPMRSSEVPF